MPGATPIQKPSSPSADRPGLLCLAQSFAPDTTPTAIRASKLLERLGASFRITVLTEATGPTRRVGATVEVVPSRRPRRTFAAAQRLHLGKLLELLVWPDESIFWVLPAIRAGRRLIAGARPQAIVVFMMPYSAGLAGVALSRLTGVPLILNLDDSPTCSDMHPVFPTRLHFWMAKALENFYVRNADQIVYVSQTNLEDVRARAPQTARAKFALVRYGADPEPSPSPPRRSADFEIAYVGAMSGWWALIDRHAQAGTAKRAYRELSAIGRYERLEMDQVTSSPAIIGQAILDTIRARASWEGRIRLALYGNPYPEAIVARALAYAGLEDVVSVQGPAPHAEVPSKLARADLLFLTLPARLDGSRGGRISAKTYEYLATDRPILAAVPNGENWDYLLDKPGVWLVAPDDERAMAGVIGELARAKFAGEPRAFDRRQLRNELSYGSRAEQFAAAIAAGVRRRTGA